MDCAERPEGECSSSAGWLRHGGLELRWLARVVISAAERFYWDNGFSKAAALAYNSLLSLVPIFALSFGMLASFALSQQYVKGVENWLVYKFMPAPEVAAKILEFLSDFSQNMSALNAPMLAFFVITSILLINAIESTFNETWQVYEPRPWTQRIGTFCAIILIAPVMALSIYFFVELRLQPFLEGMQFGAGRTFSKVYNYLLPFFLVFFALVCLYYLVPKAPVKLRAAVCGALLTAIVFMGAYVGFAVYIEHYASYDRLYGTIAAIPIFLLWLYIFWTIVLLGVETCYQAQHLPREGRVWKRTVHSLGDGRMLLAMQALVMIARRFLAGEKMPNDLELAERLGCSTVVLKPALDALQGAQIISCGDTKEKLFTLLRSPDRIGLEEIRGVIFRGGESMRMAREMGKLFLCFDAGGENPEGTLMDIVNGKTL
jgi:membrane protein